MKQEELKEILRLHKMWLDAKYDIDSDEEGGEKADLREADLSSADLSWADLRWADLRETDLRWADLREADLRWADLRRANLRRAKINSNTKRDNPFKYCIMEESE